MGYNYKPAYYSSVQDSITSICKNILPFSLKKRLLLASERKLSKQQSDNLKWQQDSFHQILKLMGLCKEGMIIVSRPNHEQPAILRDKLLFLQELVHEKCISLEEYHASKRPLLQRLALQGAEINARDLIVGTPSKESSDEEWSVIDLRDEQYSTNKENPHSRNKTKQVSAAALRQIKGAASVLGLKSASKQGNNREERSIFELPGTIHQHPVDDYITKDDRNRCSRENPFWNSHFDQKQADETSLLMPERSIFELPGTIHQHPVDDYITKVDRNRCSRENPFWNSHFDQKQADETSLLMPESVASRLDSNGKVKKKVISSWFSQKEKDLGDRDSHNSRPWSIGGLKKWKGSDNDGVHEEAAPVPREPSSDLDGSRIWDGPDTRQIKRKLHPDGSASDFFIDKVLGEKIKTELSRIQLELSSTSPNLQFSSDQLDAISTRLPVDKADLKKFFPKSWCDRYGEVVLDVVKKEFKEHVGEMGNKRNTKQENLFPVTRKRSPAYQDDENRHPNLFSN
ncbi:hypothetical protein AKJ16_DCAP25132 [Drosera capensis]